LSETVLIQKRIQREMITNEHRFSCKALVIVRFKKKKTFCSPEFGKKPQISNFVKSRPMGDEFFHAERQTEERTYGLS